MLHLPLALYQIAWGALGGIPVIDYQSSPMACAQETTSRWHPIITGHGTPAPSASNRLSLEVLHGALAEIRMEGPRYREKLTELSGPDLEKEVAANLGVDPDMVSNTIAEGLVSSSLIDQSIAHFAQASYDMAETKALEAVKQAESITPVTAAAAYLRAGDACIFKKDSPAAIIHYRAALALAIPESPVRLKVTLLSHLSRALQAISAKEPEKPAIGKLPGHSLSLFLQITW